MFSIYFWLFKKGIINKTLYWHYIINNNKTFVRHKKREEIKHKHKWSIFNKLFLTHKYISDYGYCIINSFAKLSRKIKPVVLLRAVTIVYKFNECKQTIQHNIIAIKNTDFQTFLK